MTATDELRRLLDERGVEHYGGYDITEWDVDGTHYLATEPLRLDGRIVLRRTCTPEQAIDATLGRGTCHIDLVGYDEREDRFQCRSCDWSISVRRGTWPRFNYCPACGKQVVE